MKAEMSKVFAAKILETVKGIVKMSRSKRKIRPILRLFPRNSLIVHLNNLTSITLSNSLSFSKIYRIRIQMIQAIIIVLPLQSNSSTNTCRKASNNLSKCLLLCLASLEQTNIRSIAPKTPRPSQKPRKPKSDQE